MISGRSVFGVGSTDAKNPPAGGTISGSPWFAIDTQTVVLIFAHVGLKEELLAGVTAPDRDASLAPAGWETAASEGTAADADPAEESGCAATVGPPRPETTRTIRRATEPATNPPRANVRLRGLGRNPDGWSTDDPLLSNVLARGASDARARKRAVDTRGGGPIHG